MPTRSRSRQFCGSIVMENRTDTSPHWNTNETAALVAVLRMGEEDLLAGRVTPVSMVIARLRRVRSTGP
jgi:hypothetical protein